MSDFSHIAVITRPSEEATAQAILQVANVITEHKRTLLPDAEAAKVLGISRELDPDQQAAQADLAVVIGGDGTLLDAARRMAPKGVPLCGVNRGRLGFLADIYPEQIPQVLGAILNGSYLTDERSTLVGSIHRTSGEDFEETAFNDVVVHSYHDLHMIELQTRIDGRALSTIRADGLIVATPTGSTAYVLSCGGPILHSGLAAMVLAPICPHMLTSRPIVIDLKSEVEIRLVGHPEARGVVSFDGRINQEITVGDHLRVRQQSYPLTLIQPAGHDYFDILRRKLHWNLSP